WSGVFPKPVWGSRRAGGGVTHRGPQGAREAGRPPAGTEKLHRTSTGSPTGCGRTGHGRSASGRRVLPVERETAYSHPHPRPDRAATAILGPPFRGQPSMGEEVVANGMR
ncbi:MAG: hypothetical protein ACREJ4_00680, partial [Candidatus Methylomirabilaceae bacterium]